LIPLLWSSGQSSLLQIQRSGFDSWRYQNFTDQVTAGEVNDNFSADTGCRVVSVTDPYGCILGFLYQSRYYFFQAAPQLHSRGLVDPVADPLLLRKSDSAGNRTRDPWICGQELWPLDHRRGQSQSQSQSHFTADSMSWRRAHFVDVWPDIASFSSVWV
jgi:hypothetical protein